MLGLDASQNAYALYAHLADGGRIDLTGALEELDWGEQRGEIAQRATIRLARVAAGDGTPLNELLPLLTHVTILAKGREAFRGVVWEWEWTSGAERSIALTCYDKFIYAQKSKDNLYIPKGKGTKYVLQKICDKWGIALSYAWREHKHKKLIYRGSTVAEMIFQTLEDARLALDEKYAAFMEEDVLKVFKPGWNEDVYVFRSEDGTACSVSHKSTLDNLVTQVIVTGKEKKGKIPVKATVKGDTGYGVLQEIVSMNGNNLKDAKKEAQTILKERGKPEDAIQLEAPDVPGIRKGHKVKVEAGTLSGYYIVLAATHSAKSRAMNLELEAAP